MQIVKDVWLFIIDMIKFGIQPLSFILTIFIIDKIKEFYKNLWIIDTEKEANAVTMLVSILLNTLFVFLFMMMFNAIFKLKFNGWVYVGNIVLNFALSCATVDLVDPFENWIKNKFIKKT